MVAAWPDEAFAQLGIDRATYIAILTHDPKLDDAALRIALRSEAAYVGAMGSRRAQDKRRARLRRGRHDRCGARPDGGADRPRPGRRDPGGDRALDPRRGGRCTQRAHGRAARTRAPGGSTRSGRDRRRGARRRGLHPVRLAQAARRTARATAARLRGRRGARGARRQSDPGRPGRARGAHQGRGGPRRTSRSSSPMAGRRASRRPCAPGSQRPARPTRSSSCSATSR